MLSKGIASSIQRDSHVVVAKSRRGFIYIFSNFLRARWELVVLGKEVLAISQTLFSWCLCDGFVMSLGWEDLYI